MASQWAGRAAVDHHHPRPESPVLDASAVDYWSTEGHSSLTVPADGRPTLADGTTAYSNGQLPTEPAASPYGARGSAIP